MSLPAHQDLSLLGWMSRSFKVLKDIPDRGNGMWSWRETRDHGVFGELHTFCHDMQYEVSMRSEGERAI